MKKSMKKIAYSKLLKDGTLVLKINLKLISDKPSKSGRIDMKLPTAKLKLAKFTQ